MREPGRILTSISIAVAIAVAAPRLAGAEQIGLAAVIRNDVSQVEPNIAKILQGDDVVRDEVVQTFANSNAKIVLKDSTNLMLGPNSRLKLDKAVFAGEKNLGEIAIKLSAGSFRFVTGNSAKESYAISTPVATMGVRGTTLDLLIERLKNTVVLKDGQAIVCAANKCIELTRAGDTAVVTANGPQIEIELQPLSWSFDSACNGTCTPVTFAQAENSLTTGSIGATGGGGTGGGGGGGLGGGVNLGAPAPAAGFTPTPTGSPLTSAFGAASATPVSPTR